MRSRLYLAATAITLCVAPIAAAQTFSADVDRYVWDLEQRYPDDASWNGERDDLLRRIAALQRLRGTAGRSAKQLADVLDAVSAARGTAAQMARFALLSSEIDTVSDTIRAKLDTATGLEIQTEAAVAWLDEDVRAIGQAKVNQWLAGEPRLNRHRRRLHRIFREAAYLPPKGAEEALALMERWPRTASDITTALEQANNRWPAIQVAGEAPVIDHAAYNALRRSPDKSLRDAVNQAYLTKLKDLEEPFGLLLTRRIEGEMAIGKLRGIPNSIDAAFVLKDGIPGQAWRTMLDVAQSSRPAMIRAAKLLARVQGVERIDFGDFFGRKAAPQREILIPEAIDIATAALAPLGPDYRRTLHERLAKPWMHLPPRPNKSGTVGIFWQAGGGHPYGLITYTNDRTGSMRLAMAAATLMWFADIPEVHTPDRREEDPAIHGNAVWYVGRILHDDELLRRTTDREQRVALLTDHLYFLWNSYFQNAAVGLLERDAVAAQERGTPLTGPQLSARHLASLRSFYGHDAGGARVPDVYATQWMTHSPMFYSHTQIVWAVAVAEAVLWAERIKAGDRRAIDGMRLTILPDGSQYSGDLMRAVGIDPSGREMHDTMISRFNRTLDQLEQELALDNRRG